MNAEQRLDNISKQRAQINGSPVVGKSWWNVATVAAAILLAGVIFLLTIDGGRLMAVWQYFETPNTEAAHGND